LQYGFTQLGSTIIIGNAHAENTGSINVLQKTGMQFIKDAMEDDNPIKIHSAINPVT